MESEDTAVQVADDTVVAVGNVDDTAAAGAYLQTNAHTASVFSMSHP